MFGGRGQPREEEKGLPCWFVVDDVGFCCLKCDFKPFHGLISCSMVLLAKLWLIN